MPDYLPVTQHEATSADGTRIAWYDWGGDGPTVVLGHATSFCGRIWEPVVKRLRPQFRCVAYDLRGHGLSERPPQDWHHWEWDRYAEDLMAVLDSGNLHGAFSVGHSCGAATALLAQQNRDCFSRLVGFEPVMFGDIPPAGPDHERDLALGARKRRRTFASRQAVLDKFGTSGPFTNLHPESLAAYVDFGMKTDSNGDISLRCDPEDEAAVYIMATQHSGFVNLPRVQAPTTVVRGANSGAFGHEIMSAVAARVADGKLITMDGTAHFGALEDVEQFSQLVIAAFS